MAATPRAFLLSRFRNLSTASSSYPPTPNSLVLSSRHLSHLRRTREFHLLSSSVTLPPAVVGCLFSGFDGGGVSDDLVSTRRSGRHEFSALANVLRRIDPLDTAVIGKGVSAPAKDSMKRTISTMLGLLPSDQFDVSIRVSKQPLHHLLLSSIITGYTLWNAEYRVSLMRNFDSSPGSREALVASRGGFEVLGEGSKESESMDEDELRGIDGGKGRIVPESLENLSPAALSYIQELESELATAQKLDHLV
ncbi:putative Seed maturation-like protein [Cocos nucifera]|uniref:Putative Seed maturation-like protein n=1 Tax=Cocos nucifera TaxID=13894 RepID=A0A8K0MUY5_COCNU|nr:putative Seed maturation-like protein [Cocos nucifera]